MASGAETPAGLSPGAREVVDRLVDEFGLRVDRGRLELDVQDGVLLRIRRVEWLSAGELDRVLGPIEETIPASGLSEAQRAIAQVLLAQLGLGEATALLEVEVRDGHVGGVWRRTTHEA